MAKVSSRGTFALLLLGGCASSPPIKQVELVTTKAMVPLVPTRLLMNPRTSVPRFYVSRLDYLQKHLVESGAFRALGPQIVSPVTIEATLALGSDAPASESAGQILSAATLFVVPAPVSGYNTLKVDVYLQGIFIRHYEYREDYRTTTSIFSVSGIGTDKDPEFLAIRNLAFRFINEIESDGVIPRMLD